jgi:predicted dehydrogenase
MYADYRELLTRKDIDAVMIAAQDHWHALIATAAVKAGKDLYCEKPLGISVEEGQRIRDAVRGAKRVFQTGTWQRSQGRFQQACRLARNGYLGKIHTVQVAAPGPQYRPSYKGSLEPQPVPLGFAWEMWRGPAPDKPYNPGRVAWPDWYLIWDYCAGFITNWGVHHLDIANWGCPPIGTEAFEVECQATYRKEGFTDNVDGWRASFQYARGLSMLFTDVPQQKPGCRFIGEEGWVHVDRSGIWAEPESLLKVKLKPNDLRLTDSDHHQDDFLKCVRSRQDPVSHVDAAHQASTLGLLADIAARLGQKLKWDPQAEQFVGSAEANRMLKRPMHNGWSL